MSIVSRIIWSDPAVQASIIQALGGVVAAIIAAICAGLIGHRLLSQERLKRKLELAIADVHFLLVVEREHCELLKEITGESRKLTIRQKARESGETWSGKFTPGQV